MSVSRAATVPERGWRAFLRRWWWAIGVAVVVLGILGNPPGGGAKSNTTTAAQTGSTTPALIAMPDLSGMTGDKAAEALTAAGSRPSHHSRMRQVRRRSSNGPIGQ